MRNFGPEESCDLYNETIIMLVTFVFSKQNKIKAET